MKIISDKMTYNFKLSLKMLAILCAALLGLFLLLRNYIGMALVPPRTPLPIGVKQRVIYDDNKHTLTTITKDGTTVVYSRDPIVDIHDDGTLDVDANAWGTEFDPLVGFGYQDARRFYAGANLFYFRQFDLFGAAGIRIDNGHALVKPIMGVSWNFWRDCSLNVGANPLNIILRDKPEIGVFLSVRL